MTGHHHTAILRVVRWLQPSPAGFAAAAAVHDPRLLSELHAARTTSTSAT
jgi:hypothetical protein